MRETERKEESSGHFSFFLIQWREGKVRTWGMWRERAGVWNLIIAGRAVLRVNSALPFSPHSLSLSHHSTVPAMLLWPDTARGKQTQSTYSYTHMQRRGLLLLCLLFHTQILCLITNNPLLPRSWQKTRRRIQQECDWGASSEKHLPGGLLPHPLLVVPSSSAEGELHVDETSHSCSRMSQWPLPTVCVSWHQWCLSAGLLSVGCIVHGSTLNILTASLEDNESDLMTFVEMDFDWWKDASRVLCESGLQLGNTRKRQRMITVQCTAGIYCTHQCYLRNGITVLGLDSLEI